MGQWNLPHGLSLGLLWEPQAECLKERGALQSLALASLLGTHIPWDSYAVLNIVLSSSAQQIIASQTSFTEHLQDLPVGRSS